MPKRKATFYGVRVGTTPGVYDDWETCKHQVLGFPGSKYKGFQTRAEAENYVNGTSLEGCQSTTFSIPQSFQAKVAANVEEKQKFCPLPLKTSANHTAVQSTDKTLSPMKETTSHGVKILVSKEAATSSVHSLIADPSNFYNLTEENGQEFVVFDSLSKFDEYFETVCRSRHLNQHNLESASTSLETRNQHESSQTHKMSQRQVAMEDGEFVYFKDEEDLKLFLKPYFKGTRDKVVSQIPYSENFPVCRPKHGDSERVAPDQEPIELFRTEEIYQLEFDGASKGNPGPAGAGALMRCPHGSVVMEVTEFLGIATNNVAEYRALILGLKAALSKGIKRVRIKGDSKLVCLQVIGAWKVQNEKLIPLCDEAKKLKSLFEVFSIAPVRREYNSEADALANQAMFLRGSAKEVLKPTPGCCRICS